MIQCFGSGRPPCNVPRFFYFLTSPGSGEMKVLVRMSFVLISSSMYLLSRNVYPISSDIIFQFSIIFLFPRMQDLSKLSPAFCLPSICYFLIYIYHILWYSLPLFNYLPIPENAGHISIEHVPADNCCHGKFGVPEIIWCSNDLYYYSSHVSVSTSTYPLTSILSLSPDAAEKSRRAVKIYGARYFYAWIFTGEHLCNFYSLVIYIPSPLLLVLYIENTSAEKSHHGRFEVLST